MKQKIIDYIENLESKANDSDKFFVERNNALIEIERLNNVINKFSEELGKKMNKIVALGTISQKQVAMNVLDKLKELNGTKRN